MLINLTNHPSSGWETKQKEAALKYGSVVDLLFPEIDPEAEAHLIVHLVSEYKNIINELAAESTEQLVVHIMGELTFCVALINSLKKAGITCIASTTKREVAINDDGTKTVRFEFVKFREYI